MISQRSFLLLSLALVPALLFSATPAGDDEDTFPQSKAAEPALGIAQASEAHSSNVTNLESEPSASILNCVSVISGDYTDVTTDYVVPGPEPLSVQRVYCSGESRGGSISYGLHWGRYGHLHRYRHESKKNGKETLAMITGGGGSRMIYSEGGYHDYRLHKRSYEKGLTNTSAGVISGRTNPLNDQLTSDKEKKNFTLTSGAGVVSAFRKYSTDLFLLQSERKPNGLAVIYDYNSRNLLCSLRSQNKHGKVLASFSPSIVNDNMFVNTSNNRTITYTFEKLSGPQGKQYYLKEVIKPEEPLETYDYAAPDSKTPHRMVKKNRPNGRALAIEYYKKGKNEIPFALIDIKDRDDLRHGRVKALKAPVGWDASLQYVYHFKYNVNTAWVPNDQKYSDTDYVKELTHGDTCVFDAYNHLSRYFYNEDQRLVAVEKFKGRGPHHSLYSRERLFWSGHRLNNRIFETKEGWAQYARQYDYDARGNICRQTLWGNLSGHNQKPICYPANGYPEHNECEHEDTFFTYSNDGLNLMTSQTEGKTAHTTYTYHAGTDLLASKLIGPLGSISLREFYEYDENSVLVVHIQDDGSSPHKDDLSGATERRVKRILPSTGIPVGLPLIIEEKYVDLVTGYEGLVQRTVQSFTEGGWLTRKEVYDQNNHFAYAERWEYDSYGNVIRHEDPAGRITIKKYDDNFNLTYEQGPCPDYYTTYSYDFSNRLIKKELVTKQGHHLSENYGYDLLSHLVAFIDIYGNKTSHSYDEFGHRTKTVFPPTLDEGGRVYDPQTETVFNELSHPVRATDARGFSTEKHHTIKGAPYKVFHPDGRIDIFVYNFDGTIKKQIHQNGSYTLYEYDFKKRPLKKETYSASAELLDATYSTYSGFHLISEKTLGDIETSYSYDFRGRLVKTMKGPSLATFEYDSMGRINLSKTYYATGGDEFIAKISLYDVLSRLIEEREEDSAGNILKKTQYEYDIDGNRKRIIDYTQAGISVTAITHDFYGRPTELINAEGQRTITRYDYNKRNALGQLVPYEETTDPMGIVTATTKDALGRVESVLKKNPLGHEIQKVAFFYDQNGNKVRQIETVFNPDRTTREITTAWQYDACNRLVGLAEAVETAEQRQTQYVYNLFGQKECIVKPDGIQLHHAYDQLGRLHSMRSSDGTISYEYKYDSRGNVIQVSDLVQNKTTSRSYNDNNNLISETLANGLTLTYDYDFIDRPVLTTLPDGSSVRYIYQANRLKLVQRCNQKGEALFTHAYQNYDCGGLLLDEKYAGAAGQGSYTYDAMGRALTYQTPHVKEMIDAYDAAGNLLSRALEDGVEKTLCTYTYNELSQLENESGIAQNSYQCDSLYNRVSKNASAHVSNSLNQLLSDGHSDYEYDFNGNVIKKKMAAEELFFGYDALDRLIKVRSGNIQSIYTYDDSHRRLSKTQMRWSDNAQEWVEESSERFLYHAQNEVGLVSREGKIVEYRTLGTGKGAEIGASVLIEVGGNAYVPQHDHIGNIICLVDACDGTLFETYRYSAFGEEQLFNAEGNAIEKSINPWRFSSKRVDSETGLVYFGRRYYAPAIGRWMTADPIGFEGGPNLYAYVLNNPLTHFDLYGLFGMNQGFSSLVESGLSTLFNTGKELITSGWQLPGCAIELLGLHCIPIPGIQDAVRCVGTLLQGRCLCGFETWKDMSSRSGDLGLPEKDPQEVGLLANGMMTSWGEFYQRVKNASAEIGGHNIHYAYNGTHGLFADLIECGIQKLGVPTNSQKVMSDKCAALSAKIGSEGTIHLYTHSQAGLIVNNLKYSLSDSVCKQISVKTFGSPVQIADGTFKKVNNYVSSRDLIPWLDPKGMCRAYFGQNSNTTILSSKHFGVDHSWENEAYQGAISDALKEQYKT